MRKISLITLCYILGIVSSFAQDEVAEYPDLKNPKIVKIQKLLRADPLDLEQIRKETNAILSGSNAEDRIHLVTLDLTNHSGQFIDWQTHASTMGDVYKDIQNLPESDYKIFASALMMNRVARSLYKKDEEKTGYLNSTFHALLDLSYRGDTRSIGPLAWAASELYILNFKDEHLDEDIIRRAYLNYYIQLENKSNLINYLRKGVFYHDSFRGKPTEEEIARENRYKNLSYKVLSALMVTFPEDGDDILHHLWADALAEWSFTRYEISYYPELGKNMTEFVKSLKDSAGVDYTKLEKTNFLFRFFLDKELGGDIQDFIKMHKNRNEAFETLTTFFNQVSEQPHKSVDVLTVRPQWAHAFRDEIKSDLNKNFPYVVRYSDEIDRFFEVLKIDAATLKKTIDSYDAIERVASEQTFPGVEELLSVYRYFDFFKEAMKFNKYRPDEELKWELAKMALDFEYYYLRVKQIHSPSIIGIGDYFKDWTATQLAARKAEVETKILRYLKQFNRLAGDSMEYEIVMDTLKSLSKKLGLL